MKTGSAALSEAKGSRWDKIARDSGSYGTKTAGTHDSSERTTAAAWTVTVRIPT